MSVVTVVSRLQITYLFYIRSFHQLSQDQRMHIILSKGDVVKLDQAIESMTHWHVRRQTYGCLPSRRALPPFGQYQIILLGVQRHTCANNLPRVVTTNYRDVPEPKKFALARPANSSPFEARGNGNRSPVNSGR